ncbi:MAG TPA: efflux RND transporter periplasmic adaptor subunit [Parachlamydiaceae bacterium]|nr:efflux RND transporter periplasmic adaptor subunit [Parachlamydiaceae bacterium]
MQIKPFTAISRSIALACISGLLLTACDTKEKEPTVKKEAPAIPVIVTTPTVKEIIVYMESIGTLQPSILMEIRPETSGKLINVMVDEGQIVKEGDPLFVIDPQRYEYRVHEAEAQLAIDQAGFEAVQKKMMRYKDLAERDLVAKTEWDELKAQLKKSQAFLDLDHARLKFAQLELESCTLYSPIDGRIGKLDAANGLLVANGQSSPLATISQIDPLYVEFNVTEKEFPLLPKDTISFKIQALCTQGMDECQGGTVTFLDNHFDSKTGQLLVKGKIDNADNALRPGQSVRVHIPISLTANAKVIPQKAIRYNQQGPYIYVVNDDMTVATRQLVLGKEHGTEQIVLEGVDPDERIILEGHLRISPGLKVEIK